VMVVDLLVGAWGISTTATWRWLLVEGSKLQATMAPS